MNRLRVLILLFVLQVLPAAAICAAGADSIALFRQQYSPDPKARLEALEQIYSKVYGHDYRRGAPYAWKALVLAERLDDGPRQILARHYLARRFYETQNMGQCIDMLTVARQKAVGIRDRVLTARSCSFLGMVYQETGDHRKALKYVRESMKYDTTAPEMLARNYMSLGIIFSDAGNFTQAADYYHKSLALKEKLHDTGAVTVLYCNLSDIYAKIGNESKALEYNEAALKIAAATGDIYNQGYCLNGLGSYWFSRGDYPRSLDYYRQALSKKTLISDYQGTAFVLTNMGEAYSRSGRLDSAGACYRRSLRYSDLAGDKTSRCCTFLSMSRLAMQRHNFSEAEEYARKSLQLSEETGFTTFREEIYGVWSSIADSLGHPDDALALMKKRDGIRDSIYKERAQQLVTDMMIRYELDRHQNEIVDLTSQVSSKNRRITIITMGILGLLLLGGAGSVVLYRIYRKKLRPKVISLSYIQEKILEEARKDSRRMRSLKKILPPEMEPAEETRAVPNGREESLAGDLERLMSDEKIFLKDDLSLSDVAQILKSNTSYLSRLINDTYHENFNTFINRYRVEAAKQLIREDEQARLSYEGIAHSVGFRSRSAFYQAFKSVTGQTPGEFAASH